MKNLYYFLACSLLIMSSCSDKGKKENTPAPPAKVTAHVSYKAEAGADFLTLFTLSVTYTDAEGNQATETITQLPWTKDVRNVGVPFTAQMKFVTAPVESYPDKEIYEVGFGYDIDYSTSDGQGYQGMETNKLSIGKDKIEAYRESFATKKLEAAQEIKAKE